MPTAESHLIGVNRKQTNSEVDDFTERRYRQFSSHLPRGAETILDVGCNTGRGGGILKGINPAWKIVGLDCDPARVAALLDEVYSEKICGFTQDLSFADRSIDAIVGGEFIEHVPPEQVGPTLCEFFRVLRLRGILLLTTPNPHYLKNKLRGLSVLTEASHLSQHYPGILRRRLWETGFSSVKIRGSGRVSAKVGTRLPLFLYGSYLILAKKW